MKKIITLLVMVCLLGGILVGCSKKSSFNDKYQKVVAETVENASKMTATYSVTDSSVLVYEYQKEVIFASDGYEVNTKTTSLSTSAFELQTKEDSKVVTDKQKVDYIKIDINNEYFTDTKNDNNTLTVTVAKDKISSFIGIYELNTSSDSITFVITLSNNKIANISSSFVTTSGKNATFTIVLE